MKKLLNITVFLLTCTLPITATEAARIYKWTDAEGKTHFSDKRPTDQTSIAPEVVDGRTETNIIAPPASTAAPANSQPHAHIAPAPSVPNNLPDSAATTATSETNAQGTTTGTSGSSTGGGSNGGSGGTSQAGLSGNSEPESQRGEDLPAPPPAESNEAQIPKSLSSTTTPEQAQANSSSGTNGGQSRALVPPQKSQITTATTTPKPAATGATGDQEQAQASSSSDTNIGQSSAPVPSPQNQITTTTTTPGPDLCSSLATDLRIILCNDFDHQDRGTYDWAEYVADWGEGWGQGVWNRPRKGVQDNLNVVDHQGAQKALRVRFRAGEDVGAKWRTPLEKSYDEVFYSFWMYLGPEFPLEIGGKVLGLCGGNCPTGGKNNNGQEGWSTRLHFGGPNGSAHNYTYHHRQGCPTGLPNFPEQTHCDHGSGFWWSNDGRRCGERTGRADDMFQRGRWKHYETRVVMNTSGIRDGIIQTWVNGAIVLDLTGCHKAKFRNFGKTFGIDTLIFTLFVNHQRAKEITRDSFVFIDNVVVSRERVGPNGFR